MVLPVITGMIILDKINNKFKEYEQESLAKGGTIDGVNHEIEWRANMAGAVVYGLSDLGIGSLQNKVLNKFGINIPVWDGMHTISADGFRTYVANELYKQREQLDLSNDSHNQSNPSSTDSENYPSWDDLTPEQQTKFLDDLKTAWLPDFGDDNQTNLNDIIGSLRDDYFMDKIKELVGIAPQTTSPIILDLNGDGVTTTSIENGVHFDHDGNGYAEKTGWVSSTDGLLVLDKDGNGVIDNGNELFGNNTQLSNGTKADNTLHVNTFSKVINQNHFLKCA